MTPSENNHRRVLVVEDDKVLNRLLCDQVERLGYAACGGHSLAETQQKMAEAPPDLMLVDMNLPDADGFNLLEAYGAICPVIFMTAYGAIDQAVRAVHSGAVDYLVKPIAAQTLELAVRRAFATVDLERNLRYWQSVAQQGSQNDIVGDSPDAARLRELVALYAPTETPLLICGEGGTGKELIARLLHNRSPRAGQRFVTFDCDTLDDASAEVELFGAEPVPGQDAAARQEGALEIAAGGTVFLNDIAELPLRLQARLLRLLESGGYTRAGGKAVLPANIRIIAATRKDLSAAVADKTFRSELYYRLSAFEINVPPLRMRRTDIPILAQHFLTARQFNRNGEKTLPEAAIQALCAHDWPGNVRELQNTIERGIIMSGNDETIIPEHLALPLTGGGADARRFISLAYDTPPSLEKLRDDYLRVLLDRFEGNRQKVAQTMEISERNTYRLIRKLGL